MELTVLSAEDLKPKSSSALFPRRLRPFVTLTLPSSTNGEKPAQVYKTTVDDAGGVNPSWGDKFRIPLDHNSTSSLYYQTQSQYYCPLLYLQLCTKDLMGGQTQLGWCQIPAADVLDGLSPAGHVRRLSYRLRDRDGCRGHGVVNIAVKLDGSGPVMCPRSQRLSGSDRRGWLEMGLGQTVIGIPVRQLPAAETCQRQKLLSAPGAVPYVLPQAPSPQLGMAISADPAKSDPNGGQKKYPNGVWSGYGGG